MGHKLFSFGLVNGKNLKITTAPSVILSIMTKIKQVCGLGLFSYIWAILCNVDPDSTVASQSIKTKRCLTALCRWALLSSMGFYWLQCSSATAYPPQLSRHTCLHSCTVGKIGNPEEFCQHDMGDSCTSKLIIVCYCNHGACIHLHTFSHISPKTNR